MLFETNQGWVYGRVLREDMEELNDLIILKSEKYKIIL